MEQKLEKLSENVNDIKTQIQELNKTLENIEGRLSGLVKVDSIEHRVAVNQIDLSDIKDALERIEETQKNEIQHINRRLDTHLVKLAKAEEEIMLLRTK
jgi:broad-specificity NMP kinase